MKKLLLSLLVFVSISFAFDYDGHKFGAGIYAGANEGGSWSGLHAKLWQSHTEALDFAVNYNLKNDFGMGLQADYLIHQFEWIHASPIKLPVYYGGGGYLSFWTWKEEQADGSKKTKADFILGVRIPFGIALHPTNVRFEPFLEIAPSVSILPSTGLSIPVMLGVHYYF